jgi:hypothetical protein
VVEIRLLPSYQMHSAVFLPWPYFEHSLVEEEEPCPPDFAGAAGKPQRNSRMRDAAGQADPKHWLARWENKALQRPTTSAYLRVAVVETVGEGRKPYSAAFVVRHCTSVPEYKW